MSKDIIIYEFSGIQIRSIIDDNGTPWVVLVDALTALESSTSVYLAKQSIEQELGDGYVSNIGIKDTLEGQGWSRVRALGDVRAISDAGGRRLLRCVVTPLDTPREGHPP